MSVMDIFSRPKTARGARLAGFIGGLAQRFQSYRTYRQVLSELESLSDRELADLGISRHAIRSIAYRAAYSG